VTDPGTLSLGISPCPNDTFVFDAWVHGRVEGPPVEVSFADIDVCNRRAVARELDVVKVSFAALPELLGDGPDDYALLPCGGALGRGCGPLVLTRDEPTELADVTVAVPGERTTAYLLLRLWRQGLTTTVLPFERIMPAVAAGDLGAGLVIHESRFTYPGYGLVCRQDLGAWWEEETGLPIPLGAIVAKRSTDLAAVAEAVRRSVRHAWADPGASRPWVRAHSQEMSDEVCDQHIGLYVNAFTEDLGDEGHAAVRALLDRAAAAGLLPPVDPALLAGPAGR
jgi:1,4-dihydroxy-6-naphthoate synthase